MAGQMKDISRTFSIDLWHGSVMDQKRSGRCWIYASLNPLRHRVVQKYGMEDFQFSINYIYYFDQLEKSRTFLERMNELQEMPLSSPEVSGVLREPVSSVGQWSYFAVLAERYGVVPLSAMPDTEASQDGMRLTRTLNERLRRGAAELRSSDAGMTVNGEILADIKGILGEALGMPPKQFGWNGESYTPLTFFRRCCDVDFRDYVMVMHHPSDCWPENRAYHEEAILSRRHPLLTMLSVDLGTMKELVLCQLQDGEQVVIGCDVRHRGSRGAGELSTEKYGMPWVSKKDAIQYREINACHVMSMDGAEPREGRWRVQDSHGLETGPDGHYVMTDGWFDAYVLNAVVRKKYLSPALQDILGKPAAYMPKTERF